VCSAPARTIIESGTDAGTFRGAAIYVDGTDVVIVSELSAGWYRYISQWRLRADGTITHASASRRLAEVRRTHSPNRATT